MNLWSRFFIWQSDGHKPKYRLTKWNIIYRQKYHDRLGVEVLEHKNKCLLIKWLFKIINEEGVWQELFQNKYLHSKSLTQVKLNAFDSPFWKSILKVRHDSFSRGHFLVGKKLTTSFWEDTWLEELSEKLAKP
jgi:hypothetical protein